MRILPILFNTDMVKAIMDGCKTVTRRVVKPQPILNGGFWELGGAGWSDTITSLTPIPCHSLYNRMPYKPGDILYVRETWGRTFAGTADQPKYVYLASDPEWGEHEAWKWRPSIHMPKEAARIFLRVTDVRVERLQEISLSDCVREGIPHCVIDTLCDGYCDNCDTSEAPYRRFRKLWDSTVKPADLDRYGFDASPWVWVIGFERCEKPEGWPSVGGDNDGST